MYKFATGAHKRSKLFKNIRINTDISMTQLKSEQNKEIYIFPGVIYTMNMELDHQFYYPTITCYTNKLLFMDYINDKGDFRKNVLSSNPYNGNAKLVPYKKNGVKKYIYRYKNELPCLSYNNSFIFIMANDFDFIDFNINYYGHNCNIRLLGPDNLLPAPIIK